jgi:Fe-S-cluster containining protein
MIHGWTMSCLKIPRKDVSMEIQMECRTGCAACCIAPSISSSLPGMEDGKPAGVRCIQLSEDNRCRIFASDLRPAVCGSLRPNSEMCGSSAVEAMQNLTELERLTRPKDG